MDLLWWTLLIVSASSGAMVSCVIFSMRSTCGCILTVFVVTSSLMGEAAILAALRARLGPLIAPGRVIWRQDWPDLPSGKTDMRRLMAEVAG